MGKILKRGRAQPPTVVGICYLLLSVFLFFLIFRENLGGGGGESSKRFHARRLQVRERELIRLFHTVENSCVCCCEWMTQKLLPLLLLLFASSV